MGKRGSLTLSSGWNAEIFEQPIDIWVSSENINMEMARPYDTSVSGLIRYLGATKDEKFRAFDKKTGQVLWETKLPAGGYATPSMYSVGGRQYVVIAAGGGKMGTKSGDSYVAFALPNP